MSLPDFSTQAELFSTAGLSASLFAPRDRYRLLAKLVYPKLVNARGILEKCYCADNGRVALEPVLMLGVSILQELDGVPDRQAVEMVRYHAGWNFALNRQIGDEVFHSTSLVNFRHRLGQHEQSALGCKNWRQSLGSRNVRGSGLSFGNATSTARWTIALRSKRWDANWERRAETP